MHMPSLIWILLLLSLLSDSKVSQPLSVCEVLKALPKHRNQMVTIRGEVLRTEEGTYLRAVECQKPLLVAGLTWEPAYAIHLTPPDSPLVESPELPIPTVTVDPASSRLMSQYAADAKTRIWLTVRGRLETRITFELVKWGDGKLRPYGYGHLNLSPAQLVYQQMKDAVVQSTVKNR